LAAALLALNSPRKQGGGRSNLVTCQAFAAQIAILFGGLSWVDCLPDAPNGQVITEVIHTGARDQAYRNTYKAIPSDRRFRLPIDEAKWPRMAGTLSARITSPNQYKYAYLTQAGHYIVAPAECRRVRRSKA